MIKMQVSFSEKIWKICKFSGKIRSFERKSGERYPGIAGYVHPLLSF